MNKLLQELEILKSNLDKLNTEDISNLDLSKTVLFIVDMNNGFAKQGSLYSPRIENLIKPINLDKLNTEDISNLDLSKTVLFIVDMNNGFAKQGSLYSPRIENLIKPIENFAKHICPKLNRIIAFTDSHTESSIELLN